MKQGLRNKSKYTGFTRVLYSAKYSIDGLVYAYAHEKSLLMHAILSFIAVVLGLFFRITLTQWSMILISLGVILSIELLNTAIEAIVDMVTLEYNELAKIAKDCGSAATFVASLIGIIIGLVVFVPHFLEILPL